MATIPRYQNLGVQYADLPRISTAAQQAQAEGFTSLGRSLDRMTAFFEEKAVTEAKRQGMKYAAENPLTQEQVNAALKTEQGVKVEGAGSVFQQSYEKMQGALLSSQLQLEGQRKLANVAAAIEAGAPVDLNAIQADIKDMTDGYAASVMALDPEQSVRLRAAIGTAGNALYSKAAERAIKVQQAQYTAYLDESLTKMQPLLEAIVSKTGTIDPTTGQMINIDQLIETQAKPFLDAIRITGNDAHYKQFAKQVKESKMGALVAKAQDREWAANGTIALEQIRNNNFGQLTTLVNSLSQKDMEEVRKRVLSSYSDEQTAADQVKKQQDRENKEKGAVLIIEALNPSTSTSRVREIATNLVDLGQMTYPQAYAMIHHDPDAKGNVDLFVNLDSQIARGQITNIGQLSDYRSRLSDNQFKTLGLSVTSTQGKEASSMLALEAGIKDNPFATADQRAKHKILLEAYKEELAKKESVNGVDTYLTPTQSARNAIRSYADSKQAKDLAFAKENAEKQLAALLGKIPLPNMPIEQIDPTKLGLSGDMAARAKQIIDKYKKTLGL